jgi:15-cis-phytoene synthase
MLTDDYCRERAARRGASLHYSLLFTTDSTRRRLLALHALRQDLCAIERECSDAQVARLKLQWWRDELQRGADGTAQHPAMQALCASVAPQALPMTGLLALIDNLETALATGALPTAEALVRHCRGIGGLTGALATDLSGAHDTATRQYGVSLGAALQFIDLLFDLRADAARNRLLLPREELTDYRVTAADLSHADASDAVRALLRAQIERARQLFTDALQQLPAAERWSQHHGVIIAQLHLTLLDTLSADPARLLRERVSLPAWRKLWIAWRTAAGARRADL